MPQRVVGAWVAVTGRAHTCLPCHAVQDVKSVVWHPSGELLASCSYDDSIKLWANDGDEWVCSQTLSGAFDARSCTTFVSVWAGKMLIAGCECPPPSMGLCPVLLTPQV